MCAADESCVPLQTWAYRVFEVIQLAGTFLLAKASFLCGVNWVPIGQFKQNANEHRNSPSSWTRGEGTSDTHERYDRRLY